MQCTFLEDNSCLLLTLAQYSHKLNVIFAPAKFEEYSGKTGKEQQAFCSHNNVMDSTSELGIYNIIGLK